LCQASNPTNSSGTTPRALNTAPSALLLCGAPPQPAQMMERADFHRHVGADNILPTVDAALRRAEQVRPA